MIWLLTNIWWLVPLALVAGAAVALAFNPALALLARRVPWQVWATVAVIATLAAFRWHYIGVGMDRCRDAQATAEARADRKAIKAGANAARKAQVAVTAIKKETDHAADRARVIVREVTRDCPLPAQPDELRDLGESAVERANRAL